MLQFSCRRAVAPLRTTLQVRVQAAMSSRPENEYYYQTDFSHASVVLGETTASMAVNQKLQSIHQTPQTFVNNAMERRSLQDMKGGKVELHRDFETGIAEVKLSNPKKANSLTGSMMVELADIIQDLESWDDGKAVVIHGDPEGRHFCSGADIEVIKSLGWKNGGMMCLFMQNVLSRLQRLPMISVAAIAGKAVGGGAELVTACDFRVMHQDASIQFVQGKIGLSPGFGGGARLVRIVGPRSALKMLAGAESISSEESLDMGLSDFTTGESADGGDITKAASDWLKQYTSSPVDIVRAMKTVVRHGSELPLDQALQREKHVFISLWAAALQKDPFKVREKAPLEDSIL